MDNDMQLNDDNIEYIQIMVRAPVISQIENYDQIDHREFDFHLNIPKDNTEEIKMEKKLSIGKYTFDIKITRSPDGEKMEELK